MRKDEVNNILIAGGMVLISVVLAVISWLILPDMVSMQFKGLQTGAPALPKLFAVLIAFGFSAGFSVASARMEEARRYAFIGYALHILFWISNL